MNEAAPTWPEEDNILDSRLTRFRALLARTEGAYLEILRAVALLIATFLLLWIGWLLVSSAYNISQNPDGVAEDPVAVTADDVAAIPELGKSSSSDDTGGAKTTDPVATAFANFRAQYFKLYQTSFERYRQKDDKPLTREQFTERFLSSFERVGESGDDLMHEAFVSSTDFNGLLATMTAAAKLAVTGDRLQKYKTTSKQAVKDQIRKTRSETYCSYYSDYFQECLSYDSRSVPYTESVTRLETPKGILSPQALFAAYQDNYLSKLNSRRDASSTKASRERASRIAANEKGWAGLNSAAIFGAAFLAIMFFFLLIAIERHQRKIAQRLT